MCNFGNEKILMKNSIFIFLFIYFGCNVIYAQNEPKTEMNESVKLYNEKINEFNRIHAKDGFAVYKEQRIPVQSGNEYVLLIQLTAGTWYHFSYVGDPNSEKIKTYLFKEGVGDLVQARIYPNKQSEFWTEFSFIPPQSGIYELSLFQKCSISRPLSYLTVYKKIADVVKTE